MVRKSQKLKMSTLAHQIVVQPLSGAYGYARARAVRARLAERRLRTSLENAHVVGATGEVQ
jgi:hypothetical protein